MSKYGWKMITEGLFRRGKDLICLYVDDLLVISDNPGGVVQEIKQEVKIEKMEIVEEGKAYKYLGFEFMASGGRIEISVRNYLNNTTMLADKRRPISIDMLSRLENDDGGPICTKTFEAVRSMIGELGWVAQHNHHCAFLFSFIASHIAKAGNQAAEIMKRTAARMITFPNDWIEPVSKPEIRIYADASLKLKTARGRGGWLLQVVDEGSPINVENNVLLWKSFTLGRLHGSTASAELSSLLKGIQGVSGPVRWLQELLGPMKVRILGDSVAALTQAHKGRAGAGGPVEVEAMLVNQELIFRKWDIEYVPTKDNLADCLTKLKVHKETETSLPNAGPSERGGEMLD